MKINRMLTPTWLAARTGRACLFLAAFSTLFSLQAQTPGISSGDDSLQPAEPAIAAAAVPAQTHGSVDLSEMVAQQAPSVAPVTVPSYVPNVVAAYLPVRDTNAVVGLPFAPGSSQFVYLMAGRRPPGGDPRLPPEQPVAVQLPVAVSESLVTYEPAPIGSRAVMTRVAHAELVREFPPGTFRRPVAPVVSGAEPSRAAVSVPPATSGTVGDTAGQRFGNKFLYPEPATTETGEELIRTFPPGATLLRGAPPSSR